MHLAGDSRQTRRCGSGSDKTDTWPAPPTKQRPIDLPHGVTAAEGFRRIVDGVLAHLMINQPAAAAGDVEGVHQMRVAIRRLRAALMLFRPQLEAHAAARFTEALRSLGRTFGEARDWDVFCTEMLVTAQDHGVARSWLDLLQGPAEAERFVAHARVAEELRASILTATVLGLAQWQTSDRPGADALDRLGPDLMERLERKVLRRGGHVTRLADTELHALRKSLKKLRYSVEFLAPLYQPKQVKAYLRPCKKLLKQLGALNDSVVAVALAERLGGDRQPELVPAVETVAVWANGRRDKARRHIHRDWRAFTGEALPRTAHST
jgi:CHAD domain-containing protein